MIETLLFMHGIATAIMAGLIWFVQIVHYPLMAEVGERERCRYAREHQRRTMWVVGPVMGVETASAALLAIFMPSVLSIAGVALLAVIWGSTMFVQVPLHTKLAALGDVGSADYARIVGRLTGTNWIRTAAWTARLAIAIFLLRLG